MDRQYLSVYTLITDDHRRWDYRWRRAKAHEVADTRVALIVVV